MVKQRGFTLIEMMIVIAIGGIIFAIALPVLMGKSGGSSNVSWGFNGVTESRCIEGYKFIIGEHGQARQILDEMGKGVKCQTESVPNGLR